MVENDEQCHRTTAYKGIGFVIFVTKKHESKQAMMQIILNVFFMSIVLLELVEVYISSTMRSIRSILFATSYHRRTI